MAKTLDDGGAISPRIVTDGGMTLRQLYMRDLGVKLLGMYGPATTFNNDVRMRWAQETFVLASALIEVEKSYVKESINGEDSKEE